jgi:hypothetical protein
MPLWGDSFTFGLGVNDHETFVHLLNARAADGDSYLNFAIPGFSTDQEYLLIRRRVFDFNLSVIVLVTYLGNDLFDNQLPFPLQAHNAKPFFELAGDRLVLKNSPVPPDQKVRCPGRNRSEPGRDGWRPAAARIFDAQAEKPGAV